MMNIDPEPLSTSPKRLMRSFHGFSRALSVFAMLLAAVILLPACSDMQESLNDMNTALFPMTPREAAMQTASYDPDKRRNAFAAISAAPFGGEEVYLRLYRTMIETEPDPTVRAVLIKALGDHGEPEDCPTIAMFLIDYEQQDFVRWEAAKALQRLHFPKRAIIESLKTAANPAYEENNNVRAAAAHALGQYADPTVFQTLVAGLNDRDYSVIHASHRSLVILTGKDYGMNADDWMTFENNNIATLFDDQEVYTFEPYVKPRGFVDKMQFWKQQAEVQKEEKPTGLEPAANAGG